MPLSHTPLIIFAGGKSSRMGSDKALLPFGEQSSLAAYQYQRLKPHFPQLYLSSKEEKFDFDAPVILDRCRVYSPLCGIVSAFEDLGCDAVGIVAVDTPFIPQTLIATLLNQEGYDVVALRHKGKIQPLCARYSRTFLPLAKEALAHNRHRLTSLIQEAKSLFIDVEDEHLLRNLNYPSEYQEAAKELF